MPASASLLPRRRSRPAAHKVDRARTGETETWFKPSRRQHKGFVKSRRGHRMCRNIKPLFNFDPPVTSEEIQNASLQFVRKISGFNKPSKANETAFLMAVDEIAAVSRSEEHTSKLQPHLNLLSRL